LPSQFRAVPYVTPTYTCLCSKAIEMGREGKTFTGGHGACEFNITYYKQRKRTKVNNDTHPVQPQLWKLATRKTLLRHSTACPGVLKLKARQLMAHSGFRNQVCSFSCLPSLLTSFHIHIKLCVSRLLCGLRNALYGISRLCAMVRPVLRS
jgi:hypothetical protein